MLLSTFVYSQAGGWPNPHPVHLDGPNTLVLAFGASEFADDPRPFEELALSFPRSIRIGCSTAGEIYGRRVSDASIVVAVAKFEHTQLRLASSQVACPTDSEVAGEQLAQQLVGDKLQTVFLLSDGLCINGTTLVRGLVRHLPEGVTVTGGLAGDGESFSRTWVLADDLPLNGRVCAVGLYGARLHLGLGCNGGWSDFGPERRITRSEGNVLYELDGMPALDLYKLYLGELSSGLPGTALLFPLSIRRQTGAGPSIVRTILGVNEGRKALTFAGDMPQGAIARLMRANSERLIASAEHAGSTAANGLAQEGDSLVVSISCFGRRLMLRERTEEEVEAVLDAMPSGAQQVGFYSYGEVSPLLTGGVSELHNQTMTVTTLSEA
ncbi:MAG: FIST C-terminal domain-containing protein [Burkholderiaceae bacterium]|nr:FIST C-terminal domain-containing protein [Burkholderiaceae bacterium]MDH3459819.1 FIST C-terminal domain-containing protein [Burkholderiaceae bacterium]